jgi:hypothetical protein
MIRTANERALGGSISAAPATPVLVEQHPGRAA